MLIYFRKKRKPRMSRTKQGKLWESMTRNALKRIEENSNGKFWFHRLFDYQTFVAINRNLVCIKQPADWIAVSRGDFYLIEDKSSTCSRFRLDNVKPHQEENMNLIQVAGGYYWLLILHRNKDGNKHEAFALSPTAWKRVKKFTKKEGYVSASWDTIRRCADFVLERKHGVWNMNCMFTHEQKLLTKSRFKMRRWDWRRTRFITVREFPAVAVYDAETQEILIITDVWFFRNIELWRQKNKCQKKKCNDCSDRNTKCMEAICQQLSDDLSVCQIHELTHWATDDLTLTGIELTLFETAVDKVAEDLVYKLRTNWCPTFEICERGGLKPV